MNVPPSPATYTTLFLTIQPPNPYFRLHKTKEPRQVQNKKFGVSPFRSPGSRCETKKMAEWLKSSAPLHFLNALVEETVGSGLPSYPLPLSTTITPQQLSFVFEIKKILSFIPVVETSGSFLKRNPRRHDAGNGYGGLLEGPSSRFAWPAFLARPCPWSALCLVIDSSQLMLAAGDHCRQWSCWENQHDHPLCQGNHD